LLQFSDFLLQDGDMLAQLARNARAQGGIVQALSTRASSWRFFFRSRSCGLGSGFLLPETGSPIHRHLDGTGRLVLHLFDPHLDLLTDANITWPGLSGAHPETGCRYAGEMLRTSFDHLNQALAAGSQLGGCKIAP
jgi:hypothetical protein